MRAKFLKVSAQGPVVTRMNDGGAVVSALVVARGTVRINGRVWPYVRSGHYILATERPVFPTQGAGPPFDGDAARAVAQALLAPPPTEVVSEDSAVVMRKVAHEFGLIAEAHGREDLPLRIGGAVFNVLYLPMAVAHARSGTDRVTLGRLGDVLRVDSSASRFALMRASDEVEPLGEFVSSAEGAPAPTGDA